MAEMTTNDLRQSNQNKIRQTVKKVVAWQLVRSAEHLESTQQVEPQHKQRLGMLPSDCNLSLIHI